jgi:hypothetical protein
MPNIYSATTDGYVYVYTGGTWASVRDAATGGTANSTAHYYSRSIRTFHTSGRGGDTYYVARSFFAFDTSGISATPGEATLKIFGYGNGAGDVIAVKATAPDLSTDIAVADFDAITGFTAGASMNGNVTDYSAELSTWSTSGYNDITLNAAALSDMASLSVFKVCIVEYDHDYLNSAPSGADFDSGNWFTDEESTSKDPYIDYTVAATGYGNDVAGVTSISKVIGIATANISKVNGV